VPLNIASQLNLQGICENQADLDMKQYQLFLEKNSAI